ncbi:MAG: ABC transporter substrate-binding protein [Microthrixaceae bacterium]
MRRLLRSQTGTALALLALLAALSSVAVTLPRSVAVNEASDDRVVGGTTNAINDGDEASANAVAGDPAAAAGSPTRTGNQSGTASGAAALACEAGKNGGATDVGVTATKIKLASTVVLSGIGASFLSDSPKAMQAVVARVNREGGICGRTLELTVRDDAWKPDQGLLFLKNFMESKQYFALPVVPSSEGLTAAIKAGEISKAGMPVVGSDGMLIEQYNDQWVWPVATATVSTMRIMAKYAYDKGARTFGIVYDSQYKFGVEGAKAYKDHVESMSGAQMKAFVGVRPGESSYGSEVQKFNSDCNPCDMVAMLLEPGTAETWIANRPNRGKLITSGAQTLFNRRFASNCRTACSGMLVWTGYNPPIDALASLPGVAAYVNDLRAVDPGIDVTNAFAQGSYLGMSIFVEALKRVGPNLTRENLKAVLNNQEFQTDLASPLRWTPGQRFANPQAQAFELRYAGDGFSGFANKQTGWIADPGLGG